MNVVNIDNVFRRAHAIIRCNFDKDDDEMVEAVAAYALQLAARTDVVPTRSILHNYDHVQFDLHNGHYWSGNGSRFYFRYISIYIYYINTKKIRFRSTVDVERVFSALCLPETIKIGDDMRVPGMEAFCIMLFRLAYSTRLGMMSVFFGRSAPIISRIYNRMLEIVYKRIKPLLHWDANRLTVEKLKEYADAIYQHGGEEVELEWGIFRFIDGTVCPIARPLVNQELHYSGWKRYHAIKFQGVMAPDGIIMHVSGPFSAKHHDAWMLR